MNTLRSCSANDVFTLRDTFRHHDIFRAARVSFLLTRADHDHPGERLAN
jgi:hypothetical protein